MRTIQRLAVVAPLALTLGALAGGCTAAIPDGRYACDTVAECPAGFACQADGYCYRSAVDAGEADLHFDAGPRVDSGPDFDAGGECCVDDGDLCTDQVCRGGVCMTTPVICGVNEVCGVGGSCDCQVGYTRCGAAGCVNVLSDSAHCGPSCIDCTSMATSCVSGVCGVCATPADCDDSNPCTTEACEAGGICTHTNNDAVSCSDTSMCTEGERCSAGSCVTTPVNCADTNPCTLDSCNAASGCVHAPAPPSTACNDGDDCTVGDACSGATCSPGGPRMCADDGNECTAEACTSGACGSSPVAEGTPCMGSSGAEARYRCSAAGVCSDLHNCCTATACSMLIRTLCDLYGCCVGCPAAGACATWGG